MVNLSGIAITFIVHLPSFYCIWFAPNSILKNWFLPSQETMSSLKAIHLADATEDDASVEMEALLEPNRHVESVPTRTHPTPNMRRAEPSPSTQYCRVYKDEDLYAVLDEIGANNQQFMANNADEVAIRFRQLYRDYEHPIQNVHSDAVIDLNINTTEMDPLEVLKSSNKCNRRCQEIKETFQVSLEEYYLEKQADADNFTFVDEPSFCKLEKFFPIGYCVERGSENEIEFGMKKLCTSCYGVYKMSDNCFPQYFNSISCQGETGCIFDWLNKSGHGQCHAKHMSFTVMRNKGTSQCQDWSLEIINLPIACECYLDKLSWLRA